MVIAGIGGGGVDGEGTGISRIVAATSWAAGVEGLAAEWGVPSVTGSSGVGAHEGVGGGSELGGVAGG
ncbi:MAG: hypothetical protein M3R21_00585 [Candidatus Dormibacteraeota bacterium]|nr:hypothetical protein [Candidatus Dormibacteraeota bacterium]